MIKNIIKNRKTRPYGIYYTATKEYLFNRDYEPMFARDILTGEIEPTAHDTWIKGIIETKNFYKDSDSPKEILSKCKEVFNEWEISSLKTL